MQFTLNLIDSVGTVAAPVTVETEPDLSLDRLAAELAQARGLPGSADLYRGDRPLDPRQTVYTAGLRDGYSLGLGTAGPEEDEPAGVTEVRVVGGTGAGTIYRLPVGEYDLGSAPACRLWVAEPTPPFAARVIVTVDGMMLVRALSPGVRLSGASLSPEDAEPSAWPIGSQLAVGTTLLESATVARPRASITVAEDGSSREFNRPPRFVPPVSPAKFRLPASPGPAPHQQLSLVTIVLVPIVGSIVGVLASGDWKLIFLGLLSPAGAVFNRTGARRRTRADYEERVQAFEEATARARQDIEQALRTEQYALRLGHPDPAALLAIATTPSPRPLRFPI